MKIAIELTPLQLLTVKKALELYARVGTSQFAYLGEAISREWGEGHDSRPQAEAGFAIAKAALFPELKGGLHHCHSIPSPAVPVTFRRAWDIHKALLNATIPEEQKDTYFYSGEEPPVVTLVKE